MSALPEFGGTIRRLVPDRRRPLSVTLTDIVDQRATGWPDWHPEDYCHRCGHENVSWWTARETWDPVMRDGDPAGWGPWEEIVCIPCFIELAELTGPRSWRIVRDQHGTEELREVAS